MLKKRPYPAGLETIDPGCRALCGALNDLPGIETMGSCEGHLGYFFVSFRAKSQKALKTVLNGLEHCFEYMRCSQLWHTDIAYNRDTGGVWYAIIGPKGGDGDALAAAIRANPVIKKEPYPWPGKKRCKKRS